MYKNIVARKPHQNQYSLSNRRQSQQERSQQSEDFAGNFSHDKSEEGFPKGDTRSPGGTIRSARSGLERIDSILSRLPLVKESPNHQQLELFTAPQKPQKPQISSSPGVSLKQRNRYRVSFDGVILGDRLTLDEALELAKRGEG